MKSKYLKKNVMLWERKRWKRKQGFYINERKKKRHFVFSFFFSLKNQIFMGKNDIERIQQWILKDCQFSHWKYSLWHVVYLLCITSTKCLSNHWYLKKNLLNKSKLIRCIFIFIVNMTAKFYRNERNDSQDFSINHIFTMNSFVQS